MKAKSSTGNARKRSTNDFGPFVGFKYVAFLGGVVDVAFFFSDLPSTSANMLRTPIVCQKYKKTYYLNAIYFNFIVIGST